MYVSDLAKLLTIYYPLIERIHKANRLGSTDITLLYSMTFCTIAVNLQDITA